MDGRMRLKNVIEESKTKLVGIIIYFLICHSPCYYWVERERTWMFSFMKY